MGHCECCGKPRGKPLRVAAGGIWYDVDSFRWRGPGPVLVDLREPQLRGRTVDRRAIDPKLVEKKICWLTIAHLDRSNDHNWDDNLAALCVSCHNRYDAVVNQGAAHLTRARRKDAARPLLALLY